MTYSFPCTDLSVAGKMQGMSKDDWENGNSTRSGLLWEVERILKEMTKEELPDVLLMENVPQVHAERNSYDFENWLRFLRSKGYQNYWQDINAKDLGIPQNRERTFCISILSDEYVEFEFPKTLKLNSAMCDFLEDEVEERYYLNNPKAHELIKNLILDGKLPEEGGADSTRICGECLPEQRTDTDNTCKELQRTDTGIVDKAVILGIIDPDGYDKENRVYSGGGCCPTLLVGNGRVKVVTK
jgi:DNA (cytosine-5)-methyltransferase 1